MTFLKAIKIEQLQNKRDYFASLWKAKNNYHEDLKKINQKLNNMKNPTNFKNELNDKIEVEQKKVKDQIKSLIETKQAIADTTNETQKELYALTTKETKNND